MLLIIIEKNKQGGGNFELFFIYFIWFYYRFVDVGVYGVPKTENFNSEDTTRRVEEFVRKVKG